MYRQQQHGHCRHWPLAQLYLHTHVNHKLSNSLWIQLYKVPDFCNNITGMYVHCIHTTLYIKHMSSQKGNWGISRKKSTKEWTEKRGKPLLSHNEKRKIETIGRRWSVLFKAEKQHYANHLPRSKALTEKTKTTLCIIIISDNWNNNFNISHRNPKRHKSSADLSRHPKYVLYKTDSKVISKTVV